MAKVHLTRTRDVVLFVGGLTIIFCALLGIVGLVLQLDEDYKPPPEHFCSPGSQLSCSPLASYKLVETIPYGDLNQTLTTPYQSTADAWEEMLRSANTSIHITSPYISLNYTEGLPLDPWIDQGILVGQEILQLLQDAKERGVQIQIVTNEPGSPDVDWLIDQGIAEVQLVDAGALMNGYLHAKFIVVDNSTFYLGSANLDWRSLTQVKELGIVVEESHCMSRDLLQIFDIYWEMGNLITLPYSIKEVSISAALFIPECNDIVRTEVVTESEVTEWPFTYQAFFNLSHPAAIDLNIDGPSATPPSGATGTPNNFITSSPQALCGPFRSSDLNATLDIINNEMTSIRISVMDYAPVTFYQNQTAFWPTVDSALRAAAIERGVQVQLMVAQWNYTDPKNLPYLQALDVLENISVRFFEVPEIPGVDIPHSRVNHAKFLVGTNKTSITTNNWSADYFLTTGGASFVTDDPDIISQVTWIFDRDWDSQYASPLPYC